MDCWSLDHTLFSFGKILQKKIEMESSEILTVYLRLEFFFVFFSEYILAR